MPKYENGKVKKHHSTSEREELNLGRVVNILNRRKYLLVITVVVSLILVFLYNTFTQPVYQSTAVLKKESTEKAKPVDEVSQIINQKSEDQVETEIELVKTWEVMGKVIEELDLYLTVDKIVERNGNTIQINKPLAEYNREYFDGKTGYSRLPRILESQLIPSANSYSMYVTKSIDNRFELHNATNDNLFNFILGRCKARQQSIF
jgi:uncharacterized protein involved in exopolysaccharide biosynthesis